MWQKTCLFQAMVMTQLSFRHSGTSDFQKLSPQKPFGSDKVAHHFFLIVYGMYSRKAVNISILFHNGNFVFLVSRNDAYYQSDQNAPFALLYMDCFKQAWSI